MENNQSEIEQLKAENEEQKRQVSEAYDEANRQREKVSKLQSQIKGLVEGLREKVDSYQQLIRQEDSQLSKQDIKIADMVIFRMNCFINDTLTNYYNSTK